MKGPTTRPTSAGRHDRIRQRTHGGPCQAEQCALGLPLLGAGPAPSSGLTTNSRRTGLFFSLVGCRSRGVSQVRTEYLRITRDKLTPPRFATSLHPWSCRPHRRSSRPPFPPVPF